MCICLCVGTCMLDIYVWYICMCGKVHYDVWYGVVCMHDIYVVCMYVCVVRCSMMWCGMVWSVCMHTLIERWQGRFTWLPTTTMLAKITVSK
jgi:hypothetical protein